MTQEISSGWRPCVLIIEDDPAVRECLGLVLGDAYDTLFADDGAPALRLLRSHRVDAVLLDLGLPRMDGFEVLARAREIAPGLPVIIVTVKDTAADGIRAFKLGARDYITKPFDEDVVRTKLAGALADPSSTTKGEGEPTRAPDEVARPAAGLEPYLRPRCLVIAKHVGTAGALRLVLDRYIPTTVATDGRHALQVLGVDGPDCVICDGPAWAADGASFLRLLRMRYPSVRVVLLAEGGTLSGAAGLARPPMDADVAGQPGLPEAVRCTLAFCAEAGTALARRQLNHHVLAAVDYVRLHYAEDLRANDIARAAAMSRGRLTECFRAELGISLSGFVTTLRVEVAKLLLTREAAKLEHVATQAGFRDPSHLSRVFRELTRYRPGAYRRQFAALQPGTSSCFFPSRAGSDVRPFPRTDVH